MLDTRWTSMRGIDSEHDRVFQATLMAYEMVRGEVADQRWRALLYIGTSNRDLWAWLAPRLDFAAGRVRTEGGVQGLSAESRELLALAQHLFGGQPTELNVASLLQRLGDRDRAVVLGSMNEYCG